MKLPGVSLTALFLERSLDVIWQNMRSLKSALATITAGLRKVEKLLESDATWVRLGGVTINVSRDSDDNKFIEAAVLGNCHYIISGDKDLLDIKEYNNIKIFSVSEFLKFF